MCIHMHVLMVCSTVDITIVLQISLFQTTRVLVAILDEVVAAFDEDMVNADIGAM